MLVAYGPDNQLIVAEATVQPQLQRWSREGQLFCPNCRGHLRLRGGEDKKVQLHFAHLKGECAWGTEAESMRHAHGKIVLAEWLRRIFPRASVTLEERLPGPNRIADIFVRHQDGHCQAVEFQCAPLDPAQWWHRHKAYRKAGIYDTWIIGNNRKEKQEAFIEAILQTYKEALFLDPLSDPPQSWLRWPVEQETVRSWRQEAVHPALEGWVGHGYGATLSGRLIDLHLTRNGRLMHPMRQAQMDRHQLIQRMNDSEQLEPALLSEYLRPQLGEQQAQDFLAPLIRAYLRDPELLKRYNYGRGRDGQPISEQDWSRIHLLQAWLKRMRQQGIDKDRLLDLSKMMPFIGPYASFARYIEMLFVL